MEDQPAVSQLDYTCMMYTADALTAGLTSGQLQADRAPDFIRSTYDAFAGLGRPLNVEAPAPQVERPSASKVRASVGQDAIVSFEDGKRYKSLKRHLTARGLTPMEYRTKWGLPMDYPMVAPAYAAVRSELAKASGLGRKAGTDGNNPPGIVVGLDLSGTAEDVAARYPDPAPKPKRKTTRKPKLTTVPDGDVAGTMPAAEDVTGGSTDQGFGDAPEAPAGQTAEQILAS